MAMLLICFFELGIVMSSIVMFCYLFFIAAQITLKKDNRSFEEINAEKQMQKMQTISITKRTNQKNLL